MKINSWIKIYSIIILSALCVNATATPPLQTEAAFDIVIPSAEQKRALKNQPIKEWTIVVYMSADNDLELFSRRNLAQLAAVGSNASVNLLVQLDTKTPNGKKITKRYYIERNKLIVTNQNQQGMDSGDPETLIDCMRWATRYAARHIMLIFWNHGTGIIDIGKPRGVNPSVLFAFNPLTNIIELDRSVPFLDFVAMDYEDPRGICFDDSTGNYLTNQKLEYALSTICRDILGGKKIDIIGFDACLMSMLEVADIAKDYANFMVGSQEVELGTGWDYQLTFGPLLTKQMTPLELAQHTVLAYESAYTRLTNDYTQSALDLSLIAQIEDNVDLVAQLLLESLRKQQGTSVRDGIKTSMHRQLCVNFDEPSYKDLFDFYKNLLNNLSKFQLQSTPQTKNIKSLLQNALKAGMELIKKAVLKNVTGKNLNRAMRISIYLPEQGIHSSYRKTKFAANNHWFSFITALLLS